MFKSILVPIDLADTDLAKPAIATATTLSQNWSGSVRLLNVLPMTQISASRSNDSRARSRKPASSWDTLVKVSLMSFS